MKMRALSGLKPRLPLKGVSPRSFTVDALFAPAIKLLNRLKYPTKFGLMGLVALLSIGFFVVSLMFAMQGELSAARHERAGLATYQPAARLLQLTQQHMGLAAGAAAGDEAMKGALGAKRGEIDTAIKSLDAALVKAQDEVSGLDAAQARLKTVAAEWKQVQAKAAADASGVATAHAKLLQLEADLFRDIGEGSRLMSDAQPDTSFMADTLLRKLPEATDRLSRLRASGTIVLTTKDMAGEWRQVVPQVAEVERTRGELVDSIQRAAAATPGGLPKLKGMLDELDASTKALGEVVDAEITRGGFSVPAVDFSTQIARSIDNLFAQSVNQIVPALQARLDERIASLETRFYSNMVIAAVWVLALVYGTVAMFFAILGSVSELAAGAQEIRNGKLGYRIDFSAHDELRDVADQFNGMAGSFSEVIRQVQTTAKDLSSSSAALASTAASVSGGSERQSEAASSMAAAIEEMTVGIDEISRHAGSAETVANQSGDQSVSGGEIVAQTVQEMERIAEAVNESAGVIQELGRNSARISSIVNSIKEIADQTNLLALNAAIEAARAGEEGRGFAVVADEVRKLAERTGRATHEISGMVGAIQTGTNRAVAVMQDGVSRVRSGVDLTNQAGAAMLSIRDESGRVVQSIADISLALREQTAASTEIAQSVERIARMAEENSDAVAGTAATAARLESLARDLNQEVSRFSI
ncbi:methyl-accepting chemotaxis protein [Uliginosibacterium sp. H1]|uniref:methyl-accepting chemotaxis protein n=1 Tax=Uliginosibacterium sp. H1 TaxID=3114757 RepID=UPI002E1818A7|nr:methyl-accepting chemotaxis protein [Uliginosibacterium sp. H1]